MTRRQPEFRTLPAPTRRDEWLSFCPCVACDKTPCDCGAGFAAPFAHAPECVMRQAHDRQQPIERALSRARWDKTYARSVIMVGALRRGNVVRWGG